MKAIESSTVTGTPAPNLSEAALAAQAEAKAAHEKRMSFFEHLDELRWRLVRVAIGVFAGTAIGWFFVERILQMLSDPLPAGMNLNFGAPMDAFMAKIKIAIFAGFILASPWVMYQLLSFLSPALHRKEKRVLYPTLVVGTIFFAAGVTSGYMYIYPVGIQWLVEQGASVGVVPLLMIDKYVSFSGIFLLGLGLAAETPLILLAAIRFGVVTQEQLRKNWRIAFIVILLAAAIITPDWSPVTMVAVALPMAILYIGTLIFAAIVYRNKERKG